jgi:hypothetical protein
MSTKITITWQSILAGWTPNLANKCTIKLSANSPTASWEAKQEDGTVDSKHKKTKKSRLL